ncbi:hypothetical protein PybrP1_003415, partial [[Pythium] brassicae (nom. inval.)]
MCARMPRLRTRERASVPSVTGEAEQNQRARGDARTRALWNSKSLLRCGRTTLASDVVDVGRLVDGLTHAAGGVVRSATHFKPWASPLDTDRSSAPSIFRIYKNQSCGEAQMLPLLTLWGSVPPLVKSPHSYLHTHTRLVYVDVWIKTI